MVAHASGPKPTKIDLAGAEQLNPTPGRELRLSKRGREIYTELASRLNAVGFAGQADSRLIATASEAICLSERLQKEVSELPALTTPEGRPHPLIGELRKQQTTVGNLLGQLMLSPRARSSTRLKPANIVRPHLNANGQPIDPEALELLRILDS